MNLQQQAEQYARQLGISVEAALTIIQGVSKTKSKKSDLVEDLKTLLVNDLDLNTYEGKLSFITVLSLCKFNFEFTELWTKVRTYLDENNIEDNQLDYVIKALCKSTFKDDDFKLRESKKDAKVKEAKEDVVTGF